MCRFAGKSAEKLGLGSFLPCYGDLDCFIFNVVNSSLALAQTDLSGIAVVGGHFMWNIWQELPSYQLAHGNNTNDIVVDKGSESKVVDSCTIVAADDHSESDPSSQSCRSSSEAVDNPDPVSRRSSSRLSNPSPGLPEVPPCFVAMRHPVARAIAYYYQRCYDTHGCGGYQRYMNDLSVEELEDLLMYYRYVGTNVSTKVGVILDDGMNDASCRSLQSIEPSMRGIISYHSIHYINTPYQHSLSTHLINTLYQHTLSTHLINTLYNKPINQHPLTTRLFNRRSNVFLIDRYLFNNQSTRFW